MTTYENLWHQNLWRKHEHDEIEALRSKLRSSEAECNRLGRNLRRVHKAADTLNDDYKKLEGVLAQVKQKLVEEKAAFQSLREEFVALNEKYVGREREELEELKAEYKVQLALLETQLDKEKEKAEEAIDWYKDQLAQLQTRLDKEVAISLRLGHLLFESEQAQLRKTQIYAEALERLLESR